MQSDLVPGDLVRLLDKDNERRGHCNSIGIVLSGPYSLGLDDGGIPVYEVSFDGRQRVLFSVKSLEVVQGTMQQASSAGTSLEVA